MTKNALIAMGLLLALFAGGLWAVLADQEFRHTHGRVVQVDILNWANEVEDVEATRPVVVWFSGPDYDDHRQLEILSRFAWHNAGIVKVTVVNLSRPSGYVLAVRCLVAGHPGVAVLYKGKIANSSDGNKVDYSELQRLLEQVAPQLGRR